MPVSGSLIDVIVSLVLLYILTALLCSALREIFASALRLRQKALARTIRDLCGEHDDPCVTNNLAERILDHPAVRNLRMAGRSAPAYLPSRLFAGALLDELSTLAQSEDRPRPRVPDLVAAAPNADLQRTLGLFAEETAFDRVGFRLRIEEWYDDAMDRVTGWYRRRSQGWILAVAALAAVLFNLDTLEIARAIWAGAASVAEGSPALPVGWPLSADDSPLAAGLQALSTIAAHPSKLLGFAVTAVAVSLAADLWFSLMRRLVPPRVARGSIAGPRATLPSAGVLADHPAAPERAESALEASGLTRDDIEDIQRALGMTGRFLTGRLDAATRSMIEEYQLSVGRRPTGILTPYLVERLLAPIDR
ncbi:peptidoglycan-binding domain-containing protein [Thalassobaculum sp. OXR-137]|uniref:peptidoglycan-binding domain-containing protein n=1 Tax=Thalassobaculum sp. OXR-137 TaxID=3100173 RepID=UPI002AC9511D|nr:peptidoglycan-binding domain-containing protein [Thalassobaculum sp. OXR-137]WPZ33475.1 peptidoglycan-binding domain-containing protein [Thalassobaculum sp. OXR-137]